MRQILLLFIVSLVFSAQAWGQAKEAINAKADTMQKYIPEQELSTTVVLKHVIIEGNKVTRRPVILRELSVHEGETLQLDSIPRLLNQNKLRLVNMALFNDIDMDIERVTAHEINWRIKLKERWYILPSVSFELADRNFNTWWVEENHDMSRANFGLTISDYNFRGNLENLAATVQLGYTRKLVLNYQIPYIDKQQKSGLGFTLSLAKSRQTYYASDSDKLLYVNSDNNQDILQQIEAGVSYIYRPAYATRHILTLTYKDYQVGDTVLKLNPNYYTNNSNKARFLELQYRFELNKVDNWNYPLLGFKFVGYFVSRVGFQGLNSQTYINVETGIFRTPLPKWYFSAIVRGRLVLPEKQPYYFEGGLGTKTDYVRGYEYYVIDGSQYGLLRLDLKRELFNKTYHEHIKYFTAFPVRLYPKIFADAGYIKSNDLTGNDNFLANQLLYSVGVGLDIVTLYDIKVRLEFAYNHLSRNGLYLHLNSE